MKYFKASITIENSKKKYGNLPIDFVLGYENSDLNEVHFCLLENVNIPENADITEIGKAEYDSAIEVITQLDNDRKKVELDAVIQLITEKNQKAKDLESKLLTADEKYQLLIKTDILIEERVATNEVNALVNLDYLIDVDYRLSLYEVGLL